MHKKLFIPGPVEVKKEEADELLEFLNRNKIKK